MYADLNHSGKFEQEEPSDFTDASGNYAFTVPGISAAQDVLIVAEPLNGLWTSTNPVGGKQTLVAAPGKVDANGIMNVNFGFLPPPDSDPNNPPGDPGDAGNIQGTVFNDRNNNGILDKNIDVGVPNVVVYIDENDNGVFDYHDGNANGVFDPGSDTALEPYAITFASGGYTLGIVDPGVHVIRIVVPVDWVVTTPGEEDDPNDDFLSVTLVDGGQINGASFGIRNLATEDFGDLPDTYRTTLAADGARHAIVPGFRLGNLIDGETDGHPSIGADGETGGDEDGVVVLGAVGNPTGGLVAGTTNVVQVTVFGVGGYLNAWFDFNKDGDFDDEGEHALVDVDLNPGTRSGPELWFETPADMASGPIPARFRWGTAGLDYFGPAIIGEVEDYLLANASAPAVLSAIPGDYDSSGTVDQADYTAWKNSYGSTSSLAADGNNDGTVNLADYTVWRNHLGQSSDFGGGSAGVESASGSTAPPVSTSTPNVAHQLTPEFLALMQQIGATSVTYDFGAGGTRTIFNYVANASAGGQGSVASSSTTVASVASPAASVGQAGPQFVPFSTTASPRESTATTRRHEHASAASSNADLLLVDEVLSGLGDHADAAADAVPLGEHSRHHDDEFELALASAFEDDSNWWTAL